MERVSDFDYDLPVELIAQTPLTDRSASRLLHLDRQSGQVWHRAFPEVPDLLREGDLLVMNETRVSAIRLFGHKASGGAVEALLLRPIGEGEYEALLQASRKPAIGSILEFDSGLRATVIGRETDAPWRLRFEAADDLHERLSAVGYAPLPPYITAPLADRERYQTVYGRIEGSAAAPTAGLHFTEEILEALTQKGVRMAKVTLHVGTDTFRPMRVDDPAEHVMTGETCSVSEETAQLVADTPGRIVAVGTTTVRTLESFAAGKRRLRPGEQNSRLFIRPGYDFRIVDGMFTNFHMPRTTMMMMISAFAGRDSVMRAYAAAVENRYRFLSFGDSMLII